MPIEKEMVMTLKKPEMNRKAKERERLYLLMQKRLENLMESLPDLRPPENPSNRETTENLKAS